MAGNNRQRLLYTALHRFGFGVVIETTNGLRVKHGSRRVDKLHRKSESAKRAKEHLAGRVQKTTLETGLACFARGNILIDPETDFVLRVNGYDPSRFRRTFYHLFTTNQIRGRKRRIAERVLAWEGDGLTPTSFFESGPNPEERVRLLGGNVSEVHGIIAYIKGLLMEQYTAQLLSDYIQPSFVTTRNQFTDQQGKRRDADVVIACAPSYFHKALPYISSNEDVTIFRKH